MEKDTFIGIRIPERLNKHIKDLAKKQKITKSKLILRAICKYCNLKYIPEQIIMNKKK